MNVRLFMAAAITLGTLSVPAQARVDTTTTSRAGSNGEVKFPPYLQCVPYARQVSGIQIYGDAWTWWSQAEGRYARGYLPRVGAVMALRPHANSRLGHVAAVSRIIDSRTILIRHSNWSPINGRRGQIEDNVKVIDVSPSNDWSMVRIWYAPLQALGGSHWPVQGFIYPAKPGRADRTTRPAAPAPAVLAQGKGKAKDKARTASKDPIGDIIGNRMGW